MIHDLTAPVACPCKAKPGVARRGLGFLPVQDESIFADLSWPWIIAGGLALLIAIWIFTADRSPVKRASRSRRMVRRIKEA